MALVKYNNNSISAVTSAASIPSGALVPIKTLTASSSATLSFVDGSGGVVLDSTYPIYVFKFINIHPATDGADLTFNGSTDGGSNYNTTKTTTTFYGYHNEGDSAAALSYEPGHDIAQGTGYCQIGGDALGADNDQSCSGTMFIFSPSSTTFVKHFIVNMNTLTDANYSVNEYTAGYMNTTSAVDAVDFKMTSGNIDAGKIKLYGIKDS
ncbi:hypothetical protein [Pelagibacter phage HTVC010P]|uniref:hypothetical protein n=1 Tax=Pelagibacter phage HTVC010P TaxID=1283077 RepID=UPI0002B29975|nr:hypothetical protein I900_gp31 [Pelagibacter phage HTVC010P]AGE60301.1 hypothetical protein [Pelagibacter phage HTVC010P]